MTPYTYRIFHKNTNKFYYGSRTAKDCDPADLFTKYFTSSKKVHELIKLHGPNSFEIQRIRIFQTSKEAREWEARFLNRINAASREEWLNQHNGGKEFICKGHSDETKQKFLGRQTTLGRRHSEETKQKMRKPKRPFSEETKRRMSESHKGKKLSQATKDKIAKSHTGKKK